MGFRRNVHVIKSFNMGEKKKTTVGIIIHGEYTRPRSMDKIGAIVKLTNMKKANTAVRGRL